MPVTIVRTINRSSIQFPYRELDVAIGVAKAIHDAGASPVSSDQLAGLLDLQPGSGNFVVKVAAARIFGLIVYAQGKYELTDLGFSIVDKDEKRQRAARMESFLTVPLYRKVYDEFRGRQLPPRPHGLAQALIKFGVSPKQGESARLAFDKSARQAGFFSAGEDRLIEPIVGNIPAAPQPPAGAATAAAKDDTTADEEIRSGGTKRAGLPFFVQGLLESLPDQGKEWQLERRVKWLQAAAHCFDLMYQGAGEIQIIGKATPEPTSARAPAPVPPRPAAMRSVDEDGDMGAGGRPTARASKPELDDDIPF